MLEIKSISKTFNAGTVNEKKALRGLSLTLNDGDFVTVIGGNGAGKSTLLNAISGVWPVDEGHIIIDGKDVTKLPEYRRAAFLGRVFQDPMNGTAATMGIEENLALALRRGARRTLRIGIRNRERELYRDWLKRLGLGLEDRLTSKVGLLSGGQRQALTLLMATLQRPKLLLLDEPLSNLDAALREEMRGEIKEIQRTQHITIINVTHDQIEAMTMSDRVAVVRKGVLEQFASPYELYEEPVNTFVARFIGSANILPATKKADAVRDSDGMMDIMVAGCYPLKVPYVDSKNEQGFVAVRAHHMAPNEASPLKAHIRRALYQGSQIEYYLEAPGCEMFRLLTDVSFIQPEGADIAVDIKKAVWLDE